MTIHFVRDLESLHRHILAMGKLVREMLEKSVRGLSAPSLELARELGGMDDEIDRWDVRIEEECLKILALHQPVAVDLRRVIAVFKISGELERVADLAVHIAERTADLDDQPGIPVVDRLRRMAGIAIDMLHQSLEAYVQLDDQRAKTVRATDDQVDELNREIIAELSQLMKNSPELIVPAMHLFSVSRHMERVADHAKNIAKDVTYLIEGEVTKHRSRQDASQ